MVDVVSSFFIIRVEPNNTEGGDLDDLEIKGKKRTR